MKNSFILYLEQQEVFEKLKDEKAGQLIKGIFEYIKTNEEPKFDELLEIAFIPIKIKLDKDKKSYEDKCKKNKEIAEQRWNKSGKNTNECERIKEDTKNADKTHIHIHIHYSLINNILEKIEYEKEKPFTSELDELFNEYIDLRKKEKYSVSDTVLNRLVNFLKPYDEEQKKIIIGDAINGKWKDFYPPKKEEQKKKDLDVYEEFKNGYR